MSFLVQFFYLLALSLWVGSIVFFSFFTAPTVFGSLPKEMSSQVISALFPRYYFLGYVAGGILFISTLIESALIRQIPWLRMVIILIMLVSSVYAGTVILPKAHDLKVQMKTVEETSELGIGYKAKFDKIHRVSVILNLIVLVGGMLLIGILAFRLRM